MTPDRRAGVARHLVPVALAIVAVLALGGAALAASPAPAASGAPGASGGPAASGGAVSIIQKMFQPADLTVQVGDTVTWTVTDAISDPHSVTSGNSTDAKPGTVFDSGINLRKNGDSYKHTFDAAGTFPFFCAVHPETMHGTITVAAAGGGSSEAGSDGSAKLVTAIVLLVVIVLLFGWARVYRRMNPAP